MEQKAQDSDKTQQPETRKPYEAPNLVEYGNVANITQDMVMGSLSDGSARMMAMP